MNLRFKGKSDLSFEHNNIYRAKKFHDKDFGDGYAIFDEGDDWYWYDNEFVKENFDILKEPNNDNN